MNVQNKDIQSERLYIFAHLDEEGQGEFLKECKEQNIFAEPLRFLPFQLPQNWGDSISEDEEKQYRNGARPFFTVSKASPDHIGNYYNWSYLETVVQKGWKQWLK